MPVPRAAAALFALLLALVPAATPREPVPAAAAAATSWDWPLERPFAMDRPYVQPAHDYAPGHRGIDLRPARTPAMVLSPDDGVVVFAGRVVDRGVVAIDHGDGLVSTLEPVEPLVAEGQRVARGEQVAVLSTGGHTRPGSLHLGARRDGRYLNPLLLLGGVPRAILLPCC